MRLFIGLSLNPALRREAAAFAEDFAARLPGKYVEPSNYHVTLAFLGEYPEESLPLIRDTMDEAAKVCTAFPLRLRGVDYFGRQNHGILHLTLRHENAMEKAADELRASLSRAGLTFDPQPFRAHVTLARNVCVPDGLTLPHPPDAEGRANGLTLYHSTRVQDKLVYIPIFFSAFPALP